MRFNFTRRITRLARRKYLLGRITREEYDKVLEAARNPEIMEKWEDKIDAQLGAPWRVKGGFLDGFDFSAIMDWLKENWDVILRILLAILPLFILAPGPVEEEEDE